MVEEQINCVPISDPRDLTPAIFQMVIYNVFTYICSVPIFTTSCSDSPNKIHQQEEWGKDLHLPNNK